jgi:hypothetical protein
MYSSAILTNYRCHFLNLSIMVPLDPTGLSRFFKCTSTSLSTGSTHLQEKYTCTLSFIDSDILYRGAFKAGLIVIKLKQKLIKSTQIKQTR